MAKKLKVEKENKDKKEKHKSSVSKKRSQSIKNTKKKVGSPEPVSLKTTGLTKDEQLVKDKLISGGQFDALGEKFTRNRKY